jgi:hypothetical protein
LWIAEPDLDEKEGKVRHAVEQHLRRHAGTQGAKRGKRLLFLKDKAMTPAQI